MRDYDWGFGFGFGTRYPIRRGGYDRGFERGGYDRGYGRSGSGRGGGGGDSGRRPMGGGGRGPGGYDRGIRGDEHPLFGGVPGGRRQGMYYGGPDQGPRGAGYGRDMERGGVWGRPALGRPQGGFGGGERGGFSREPGSGGRRPSYDMEIRTDEPFLPEQAYRRHPALGTPPVRRADPRNAPPPRTTWLADDAEIQYAVRQNLYLDSYVDADRIEVEVDDGVVTLRGEVDDFIQARYAWDDAWETDGVRGVVNLLTVRTDLPVAEPGSPGAGVQGSGEAGEQGSTGAGVQASGGAGEAGSQVAEKQGARGAGERKRGGAEPRGGEGAGEKEG